MLYDTHTSVRWRADGTVDVDVRPADDVPAWVPAHLTSRRCRRSELLAARSASGWRQYVASSLTKDQRKLRMHLVTRALLDEDGGHPKPYVEGNAWCQGPFHYGPGRFSDLGLPER